MQGEPWDHFCHADLSPKAFPLQSRGGPYIPITNLLDERIGDFASTEILSGSPTGIESPATKDKRWPAAVIRCRRHPNALELLALRV